MNRKKLKTVLSFFLTVLFSQIYFAQTVTIGTQVWMTENLNVEKFRNGDPIPQAKTNAEWVKAGENKQPAWCYYDNDPTNGTKYGKLYNWYAVNDTRGLAPEGYHIPNDAEWTTLDNYLDNVATNKMKSTSGRDSYLVETKTNPEIGTNPNEFLCHQGGGRSGLGAFILIGKVDGWWSSTETLESDAWSCFQIYESGNVEIDDSDKVSGLSVRCLKD